MPANPKKCIGKNVKLTPTKRTKKDLLFKPYGKITPKITGDQRTTPHIIPKTAPILKT